MNSRLCCHSLPLLLAGIVDLGRSLQSYIVITNAAREGARTGARLSCYATDMCQRASYRDCHSAGDERCSWGVGVALLDGEITIFPDPVSQQCACGGDALQVTVAHDVTTFLGGMIGLNPIQLASVAAMSKFGDPLGAPVVPDSAAER